MFILNQTLSSFLLIISFSFLSFSFLSLSPMCPSLFPLPSPLLPSQQEYWNHPQGAMLPEEMQDQTDLQLEGTLEQYVLVVITHSICSWLLCGLVTNMYQIESFHHTVYMLASFLQYTVSDQKLELGKAWERGYICTCSNYRARMSPTLNQSSAMQSFKCDWIIQ